MAAVAQNGFAVECATEELRGNREILLEVVSHNGRALQFATEEMRGDPWCTMILYMADSCKTIRMFGTTCPFHAQCAALVRPIPFFAETLRNAQNCYT